MLYQGFEKFTHTRCKRRLIISEMTLSQDFSGLKSCTGIYLAVVSMLFRSAMQITLEYPGLFVVYLFSLRSTPKLNVLLPIFT